MEDMGRDGDHFIEDAADVDAKKLRLQREQGAVTVCSNT